MKTIIILVLATVLIAGMFLSKPSQADFSTFINSQTQLVKPQSLTDAGKAILGNIIGSSEAAALTYHDHVLWATEDQNGQAKYFGLFAHWWKTSTPATPAK